MRTRGFASHLVLAALIASLTLASLAATAFAGKGGGKGGGGSTGGTGTLALVLLTSPDSIPNWGETVTFTVTTTATTPVVVLSCTQDGRAVYTASAGFYPAYPWPATYTLASSWWTGGAADCVATLYTSGSSRARALGTLAFHVYA